MVCTPVHSEVSIHYMRACLDLQKECILNRTKITFQLMKSSLVTQGRNLCASAFMNSDADQMLFVDSDIEFNTRSVYRLFQSPHEISLVPYPIKQKTDKKFRKEIIDRKLKDGDYLIPMKNGNKISNIITFNDKILKLTIDRLGQNRLVKIVVKDLLNKKDFEKLDSISKDRGTSLEVLLKSYNLHNGNDNKD